MSTSDLAQVTSAPGRLCINPTDLTLAFPHGGTSLGEVGEIGITIASGFYDIDAEEFGGRIVESVWTGENVWLACTLRQWDETAVGTIFPNTTTGTLSKRVGLKGWEQVASPVRPGSLLSARSVKLLFSPLDPQRNRAAIFYRALPKAPETAALDAMITSRQAFKGCVFLAIPDASSPARVHRIDFLKDLSV